MSAYVTRSGRRTNKVNYSDTNRRSTSRSVTPHQSTQPTLESDKENENEIENEIENETESEIETKDIKEPPQKKQKISNNTSTSTKDILSSSPPKPRRRRRPIRKRKAISNNNTNDPLQTQSITDTTTTTTTSSSSIIIPPLPSLEELDSLANFNDNFNTNFNANSNTNNRKKRKITKKKTSKKKKRASKKQELSSSDESSSDSDSSEIEILTPRKKRVLPSLKPKKKATTKSVKKPRKKVEEKRRARKRICSQKTRDRISRARHQRLFMISAKNISDYHREYAVLGSTGNVYTITISTLHHCSCPDFAKGNLCKHILFILLKVLRVQSNSEYVYQKALLTTELTEIFNAAPQTLFGSVLANATVRSKYKQSIAGDGDGENDDFEEAKVERKALEGDCPVCMEEIDGSEATTWCRAQCGNNVHVECFKEWRKNAQRSGESVVCMFCRAEWVDGPEDGLKGGGKKKKKATKGGGNYNEGYMNLANEQGISTVRDTSLYYQSGWRGYGRYTGYGYGGYRRRWY